MFHVFGASLMLGGNALGFLIIRKNVIDLKNLIITKHIGILSAIGGGLVLVSGIWLFNINRDSYNQKIVFAKIALYIFGGILAKVIIEKKVKNAIKNNNEAFLKSQEFKTLDSLGFVVLITAFLLGVYLTAGN